jgi:hypothetical protein
VQPRYGACAHSRPASALTVSSTKRAPVVSPLRHLPLRGQIWGSRVHGQALLGLPGSSLRGNILVQPLMMASVMRDSRRRPASEDPDGEYSHSAVRNAAVLTATGSVRVRLLLASSRLLGFGLGRRARTWRGGLGASRSSSSHSVDGCSWAVPVGRLRVWASVAIGCCGSVHRRTSRDAGSGGCFGACAQPKGLCALIAMRSSENNHYGLSAVLSVRLRGSGPGHRARSLGRFSVPRAFSTRFSTNKRGKRRRGTARRDGPRFSRSPANVGRPVRQRPMDFRRRCLRGRWHAGPEGVFVGIAPTGVGHRDAEHRGVEPGLEICGRWRRRGRMCVHI